jgi:hypothetical protein
MIRAKKTPWDKSYYRASVASLNANLDESMNIIQMWEIPIYLLLFFSLFLLGRIYRGRVAGSVIVFLAFTSALVLAFRDIRAAEEIAMMGLFWAALVLSAFVAPLIVGRRVEPPCVRVKDNSWSPTSTAGKTILHSIFIAYLLFVVFLFVADVYVSADIKIMAISATALMILQSRQRPEICGNGIWHMGEFHPWDEYKFFSWKSKDEKAVVELRAAVKRRFKTRRALSLVVPPENIESAKRLLEANLTDITPPITP